MQKIFTERAHLMCPDMHFGIAAVLERPFDRAALESAMTRLAEARPFLRALLGQDGNDFFYAITEKPQYDLSFEEEADGNVFLSDFDRLTRREWDLTKEGMLKAVFRPAGNRTRVLFAVHHLLTDGRGALDLMTAFAEDYVHAAAPVLARESVLSKEDIPADSRLPFVSRLLVQKANRDWEKEGNSVSYAQYLTFADGYVRNEKVAHTAFSVSESELSEIVQKCHAEGVSVNDYLAARMLTEENADKVILAADLRSRLPRFQKGALGNASTAFSVVVRNREQDVWKTAKQVHDAVQKTLRTPKSLYLVLQCYALLRPALLDAAWIACAGGFDSKAAKFIGGMFFGFSEGKGHSVTNLGKIESTALESACFLPPASPAMQKTWGVLTVNGKMTVCVSQRG